MKQLVFFALGLALCACGGQMEDPPGGGAIGGNPGVGGSGGDVGRPGELPALPLRILGRWILDGDGTRFKLASVNWYGAEKRDHVPAGLERAHRSDIARRIRRMGVNSVRLPWSNELVETDPVVGDEVIAANLDLGGRRALEVLDAVIEALAAEGLVVILDNHSSDTDACCDETDGNGLWYTSTYTEERWLASWRAIVTRYLDQPAVVAAELRNALRPANGVTPVWGGGDPATDWHAAVQRGGNAVLEINPDLLVVVQALDGASDLRAAGTLPVQLAVENRLVYAVHDDQRFYPGVNTPEDLTGPLEDHWGHLLAYDQPNKAPIWMNEFSTCHTSVTCVNDESGRGLWFQSLLVYLSQNDVDWGYWALNGTQARGMEGTFGEEDTNGLLDTFWRAPASLDLLVQLQLLIPPNQGP
ncbi:glycoside hydrolase family 5 protein [Chondromyces crocatus]|uniref:Glycoside hydrolase family 5 domain-containing protein n=1 Tax=Chondromyces crocatus TaxID=52 RepID=A0A0K1ENY0_CHOCO|nr:cellulase family glycosylhydrolase [Chondromyces crocatus]AKT42362.1 uncharacterized protein CMC5_065880 [Chondromyces crocatus]